MRNELLRDFGPVTKIHEQIDLKVQSNAYKENVKQDYKAISSSRIR